MQLQQIFYLHSCAKTSAYWLKDTHVAGGITSMVRMLSTAAQFVTVENDSILPNPEQPEHPHIKWLMQSAWNYQWGLSYWDSLCELGEDIFKFKHNVYKVRTHLYKHIRSFPLEEFCPPPCLFDIAYLQKTTEESYRNFYRQVEAKPSTYNKMVAPFWVRTSQRVVLHRLPEKRKAYDLEADPLADLKDDAE